MLLSCSCRGFRDVTQVSLLSTVTPRLSSFSFSTSLQSPKYKSRVEGFRLCEMVISLHFDGSKVTFHLSAHIFMRWRSLHTELSYLHRGTVHSHIHLFGRLWTQQGCTKFFLSQKQKKSSLKISHWILYNMQWFPHYFRWFPRSGAPRSRTLCNPGTQKTVDDPI